MSRSENELIVVVDDFHGFEGQIVMTTTDGGNVITLSFVNATNEVCSETFSNHWSVNLSEGNNLTRNPQGKGNDCEYHISKVLDRRRYED